MKLIFCPNCTDVRKLDTHPTYCRCHKSWGFYHEDGLTATVGGDAVPLGIDNNTFRAAIDLVKRSPELHESLQHLTSFRAWVFTKSTAPNIRWKEER